MGQGKQPSGKLGGETPLAAILIPHLGVVLDEIFAVPPPGFFPEWARPTTVADLAAFTQKGVPETIQKLERILRMAEDIEITSPELKTALDAGASDWILLDVRESWEWEICRIPGSLRLGDVRFDELLPRLKSAPAVVTICHHGVRSFSAAMYLREQGVASARSLAGGVEDWSRTIDPAMARY